MLKYSSAEKKHIILTCCKYSMKKPKSVTLEEATAEILKTWDESKLGKKRSFGGVMDQLSKMLGRRKRGANTRGGRRNTRNGRRNNRKGGDDRSDGASKEDAIVISDDDDEAGTNTARAPDNLAIADMNAINTANHDSLFVGPDESDSEYTPEDAEDEYDGDDEMAD